MSSTLNTGIQLNQCEPVTTRSYGKIPVAPIDHIYYNKYPYRIKCSLDNLVNVPERGTRAWYRFYNLKLMPMIYAFLYDNDISLRDFMFSSRKPVAYFVNKSDMEKFITAFPHLCEKVYAPVDQQHAQGLLDNRNFYVYRDQPWYGTWNNKYEVWFHQSFQWKEQYEQYTQCRSWLQEQELPCRIHGHDGWFAIIVVYGHQSDFDHVLPFLKIMAPDLSVSTFTAIINDQIARNES